MEWLIIWLVMGVVVAIIAGSRGRNALGWFVYGVLIWPIALVHVLVATPTAAGTAAKAKREGRAPCPFCSEHVKTDASVCPFCQRDLPADWAAAGKE